MIRFDPPLGRDEIALILGFALAALIAGYAFRRWLDGALL